MKHPPMSKALIASILAVTWSSWAQTSPTFRRENSNDNCASSIGHSGRGKGTVLSLRLKPPTYLTTISRPHGGTFPQNQVARVIGYRWTADAGPDGWRQMPFWCRELKARAMGQLGDLSIIAQTSARNRIVSLLKYLQTMQGVAMWLGYDMHLAGLKPLPNKRAL